MPYITLPCKSINVRLYPNLAIPYLLIFLAITAYSFIIFMRKRLCVYVDIISINFVN